MTGEHWREARRPVLDSMLHPGRFPLASAVGTAVGSAHGSACGPARHIEFGLRRLDGVEALAAHRTTTDRCPAAPGRPAPGATGPPGPAPPPGRLLEQPALPDPRAPPGPHRPLTDPTRPDPLPPGHQPTKPRIR